MSFDWNNYFSLAEFLRDITDPPFEKEAAQLSAISRAYYASFHFACSYAESLLGFVPTKTGADHIGLIRHLQSKGKSKLANQLHDLLEFRHKSDYDAEYSKISITVGTAITRSRNAINEANHLSTSP